MKIETVWKLRVGSVQEFGMPMVPKQAAGPTRPARHAARRANARVALVEDSSEDSDWERGSAPQRSRCARRRSPKEETEPVPEAVARNRITQRQYLQRKKVCVSRQSSTALAFYTPARPSRVDLSSSRFGCGGLHILL